MNRTNYPKNWPPLAGMPRPGESYTHRNGLTYTVLALAKDARQDEVYVIHQGADGNVWSRTIGNFVGLAEDGGARFRLNREPD